MNGLLLKDLMCIKKAILMMTVVGIILTIAFRDIGDGMILIPVMISASLVGTAQAYDDECNWLTYATATGVKRSEHLKQKYVLGMITTVIGLGAGLVAIALNHMIDPWEHDITVMVTFALVGVLGGFMTIGISLFIDQRYGSGYLGIVFALSIGIIAGLSAGLSIAGIDMTAVTVAAVLSIALLVIDAIIYMANIRLLESKDY